MFVVRGFRAPKKEPRFGRISRGSTLARLWPGNGRPPGKIFPPNVGECGAPDFWVRSDCPDRLSPSVRGGRKVPQKKISGFIFFVKIAIGKKLNGAMPDNLRGHIFSRKKF